MLMLYFLALKFRLISAYLGDIPTSILFNCRAISKMLLDTHALPGRVPNLTGRRQSSVCDGVPPNQHPLRISSEPGNEPQATFCAFARLAPFLFIYQILSCDYRILLIGNRNYRMIF